MSDSEAEVEIPEPKVLTKPRPKKVMTPEQLEKLAAARVKAAKVKVLLKEERIEKDVQDILGRRLLPAVNDTLVGGLGCRGGVLLSPEFGLDLDANALDLLQ